MIQYYELFFSLLGRRLSIRLLPLAALDSGDVKNSIQEISETKGSLHGLLLSTAVEPL